DNRSSSMLCQQLDLRPGLLTHLLHHFVQCIAETRHMHASLGCAQICIQVKRGIEPLLMPLVSNQDSLRYAHHSCTSQAHMYGRFPTLDIALKRDTQRWRELLHASLWHRLHEFLGRFSAYRLDAFRRDLRQWNQHKRAFRHAWMRYRQVILLYMQVIIQKNLDSVGSRPITKRGLS